MSMFKPIAIVGALTALLHSAAIAEQAPLRIGLVYCFSGPFALAGTEVDAAINLFMKRHGDSVAGRKVEIVRRDTTGPAPDVARRLAGELVTREKVDILTGIDFTPNAVAIAAVSTEAKIPVFSMNGGSSVFLPKAAYGARFSFSVPQQAIPLASWAANNGIKSIYSLVADYSPGLDGEKSFQTEFKRAGGKVVGSVRVPLNNPDFGSYLQRIKEAKPDAVFVFLPSGGGDLPVLFLKAFNEAGLPAAGIKIIGTGETDEVSIDALGDAALGMITASHYSAAHDSELNKTFVRDFEASTGGKLRASFAAVAAYDTMTAIYKLAEAQGGQLDAAKTIELVKGMKLDSPRGTIEIDGSRDIVQTIYIRRVERRNGRLENIEISSVPNVPATEAR
jgi:branched-chain amino acid transport system substrate-binding protein